MTMFMDGVGAGAASDGGVGAGLGGCMSYINSSSRGAGTIRPLLVSHPFRRIPKQQQGPQQRRHRLRQRRGQEVDERHQPHRQRRQRQQQRPHHHYNVSFHYVTFIVTAIDLNTGRRFVHDFVTSDNGIEQQHQQQQQQQQRRRQQERQHNDVAVDNDDNGNVENLELEEWKPIIPLILTISHNYATRIRQWLLQIPDMLFLFWCMYVMCVLLPHAAHNHRQHQEHHCEATTAEHYHYQSLDCFSSLSFSSSPSSSTLSSYNNNDKNSNNNSVSIIDGDVGVGIGGSTFSEYRDQHSHVYEPVGRLRTLEEVTQLRHDLGLLKRSVSSSISSSSSSSYSNQDQHDQPKQCSDTSSAATTTTTNNNNSDQNTHCQKR